MLNYLLENYTNHIWNYYVRWLLKIIPYTVYTKSINYILKVYLYSNSHIWNFIIIIIIQLKKINT